MYLDMGTIVALGIALSASNTALVLMFRRLYVLERERANKW
jgi:hypothetical protein